MQWEGLHARSDAESIWRCTLGGARLKQLLLKATLGNPKPMKPCRTCYETWGMWARKRLDTMRWKVKRTQVALYACKCVMRAFQLLASGCVYGCVPSELVGVQLNPKQDSNQDDLSHPARSAVPYSTCFICCYTLSMVLIALYRSPSHGLSPHWGCRQSQQSSL